MVNKYIKTAERLKALAEPNRLKILEMLTSEELCVCEIIDRLHLSQPAVSHHLKILRQANVIDDRKEGKWVFYSLNLEEYLGILKDLHGKLENKPVKEKRQPTVSNPEKILSCKKK